MNDEEAFLALASAAEPAPVGDAARLKWRAALDAEPFLPFCGELGRHFDIAPDEMRALLRRIDDPAYWIRGIPPMQGYLDFRPGPSLRHLHGGFARMLGGMSIQTHRHVDRELTFVVAGALRDDQDREYRPGDFLDMPQDSVHRIHVPEGGNAIVALLNGRIEMVG